MGDASILSGIDEILRETWKKDVKLVVSDKNPKAASKYYPQYEFIGYPCDVKSSGIVKKYLRFMRASSIEPRVNSARFWLGAWMMKIGLDRISKYILTGDEYKTISEYSNSDVVISTGGTYLVEKYDLRTRIFDYNLSLFFEKPLVFFTQSIGPFERPEYRVAFRRIFRKATLILLRDQRSKSHLQTLGVGKEKMYVLADAAFALSGPETSSFADTSPKVGISVREWKHFKTKTQEEGMQDYLDAVRLTVERLVCEKNAEVTFVSTCQGRPEYNYDDSKIAQKVFDKLSQRVQKSVCVDSSPHDPNSFMKAVSKLDFMIATRMHAAILSLNAGTPVLPIAYEFKTEELFSRLGQNKWTTKIELKNPKKLSQNAIEYLGEIDKRKEHLMRKVDLEEERAKSAIGLLKKHLSLEDK